MTDWNILGDESEALVSRMFVGLDTGVIREVRVAAHALKGSAYQVGARRVGTLAAAVEAHPERCDPHDLDLLRCAVNAAVTHLRHLARAS